MLSLACSSAWAGEGELSGLVFGDYFFVVNHHRSAIEDQNGFWFRRIYLTYDQELTEEFSLRARLEMNSPGDFTTQAKLDPFAKDVYLRWKLGHQAVTLGLSPTPTFDEIEEIWGYRSVEKTPLDLQKFGSSRDLGISLTGTLDPGRRLSYHLMFGNGTGVGAETNKGKKVYLSVGMQVTSGLLVQAYGDWEDRPGRTNRYLWQLFAVYQEEAFRFGGLFAQQSREEERRARTRRLEIASVFGAGRLTKHIWAFARYDRIFDPNPDGAEIDFLPFDPTAEANLLILGVDLRLAEQVHVMPNVETVFYDEVPGTGRPDTDVIPRLTFFYTF